MTMIISTTTPFTLEQMRTKEQFDVYIKTVIDVERKIVWPAWIDTMKANKYCKRRPKQSNLGRGIDTSQDIDQLLSISAQMTTIR